MRLNAVAIGEDPPRVVNLIDEVPIGGKPIKYEMDKEAGTGGEPLPLHINALPWQLRVYPSLPCRGRRPNRRPLD